MNVNDVHRLVSVLLAAVLFLMVPADGLNVSTGYAAETATVSDADMADSEPFYYDENGSKVYDSEIDFPDLRDDYSDIDWTFEEYPETLIGSSRSRSIASVAVVSVLKCILAALGISMGTSSTVSFFADGFEPWLRRQYGFASDTMHSWQVILSAQAGMTIVGLKKFVPIVKEYIDSMVTVDESGVSVPTYSSGFEVVSPLPDWDEKADNYLAYYNSCSVTDSGFKYVTYCFYKPFLVSLLGGYLSYMDSSGRYSINIYSTSNHPVYAVSFSNALQDGYWLRTSSEYSSNISPCVPLDFIYSLQVPIFVNYKAYDSWKKFGTTGGMVNGENADKSINLDIIAQHSDLMQGFLDQYAFSDTLKLPDTEEEINSLNSVLDGAASSADVITALNPVWEITHNGSTPPPLSNIVAYNNLSYVITVLAGYCGAVVTAGQIDDFIALFYDSNVDGTAALKEAQASEIVREFVVINGGSDPNDDHNSNDYKVLQSLAVSLGVFLIGCGLISDAPDFSKDTAVNNVTVVADLPDPPPDPDPDPNPDTGVDLSGILGYLKQFLDILLAWANPIMLMDSLVGKLGLPTISGSIKSAIDALPRLVSGELTLPELFGNVTDAIFSIPQQVADAIAHALGLDGGFPDILGGLESIAGDIAAIPGQITDFFTIDTALLSAEFSSLQDAFMSHFSGITQLGSVFKRSYDLDMDVPVFSAKVADVLRTLFGGQEEIVLMDLRPYRDIFLKIRVLLTAMMWISFAKWLLDQFDVKLHVG